MSDTAELRETSSTAGRRLTSASCFVAVNDKVLQLGGAWYNWRCKTSSGGIKCPPSAGATAVLAVFLNTEEAGCCGVDGMVPPNANVPLRTALNHAPATENSPQIKVYVDLTTALPPHRGSQLPYINYNGKQSADPTTVPAPHCMRWQGILCMHGCEARTPPAGPCRALHALCALSGSWCAFNVSNIIPIA